MSTHHDKIRVLLDERSRHTFMRNMCRTSSSRFCWLSLSMSSAVKVAGPPTQQGF